MRFIIIGIIFLFLMIGVMVMVGYYGLAGGLKYEKYSSKDPELGITMDYISGWRHSEHRGSFDSYAHVLFYEPKREGKDYKAGMAVTAQKESKVEFRPLTIETAADDLLKKRMQFKEAKLLSRSKTKLLGEAAVDIRLAYRKLDKLYSVDAKLIPVKERVVIFKRGNKFYTLRYDNTEEEFKKLDSAFTHCIKSLRFK